MKRRLSAGRFAGQRVLLVGLGLHGGGASTARWFVRHGARVRITDQKTKADLAPTARTLSRLPIGWRLGGHDRHDAEWAEVVIQNPGVPSTNPLILAAEKQGKLIQNEASLFLSLAPGPIIGVTGTRGKTTTTLLIAHLLSATHRKTVAAGNFRETPMLSVLDRLTPDHWSVVELSSFHLEGLARIHRSPHIAVWTNLYVDHLNRYGSLAEYAQAKSQILRYQRPGDFAVLNADSAIVRRFAGQTLAKIIWFSDKKTVGPWSITIRDGWVCEVRAGRSSRIVRLVDFPLPGDHQRHNLLAAVGAALAAGVPVAAIRRTVRSFRSVPHRQELVRRWRGHRFINDTTATSPEGAVAAILTYPKAVYILGGSDKHLDFDPLVKMLVRRSPPVVLLPGTATTKIVVALTGKKFRGHLIQVRSMTAAVHQAVRLARPGDDIVLTPGAASFGLFKHEFDRGEQFIRAVNARR